MLGSGLNLVTTVIGFGMSATFIVFVCARLICGRMSRPTGSSHVAPPFDLDLDLRSDRPIERNMTGLEPIIVSSIPTLKYNYEAFHSKDDAQCSICLGEYQEKEMLRIIPACNHSFHLTCIDLWLQKQATCPICRLPLKDVFALNRPATPLPSQSPAQTIANRAAIPVAGQPATPLATPVLPQTFENHAAIPMANQSATPLATPVPPQTFENRAAIPVANQAATPLATQAVVERSESRVAIPVANRSGGQEMESNGDVVITIQHEIQEN